MYLVADADVAGPFISGPSLLPLAENAPRGGRGAVIEAILDIGYSSTIDTHLTHSIDLL